MKRMIMMFGFIALVAMVVIGCGGESIADEEKKADVAKIVVKKAQTHCPIMGNPVDKKVYLDYEGKRIYFCCAPCIEKFKEDPDGYIKKMEAEGIGFERVASTEDHDHGEHGHDHGEVHDHGEADDHGEDHDHDKDHDADKDHDDDADHDDDKEHDHDHGDHAGHDHG